MTMTRSAAGRLFLLLLLAVAASGCEVIAGIFKAGVWVGVIGVVADRCPDCVDSREGQEMIGTAAERRAGVPFALESDTPASHPLPYRPDTWAATTPTALWTYGAHGAVRKRLLPVTKTHARTTNARTVIGSGRRY